MHQDKSVGHDTVFFYVDESGHTGANLFDEAQPALYYGVLRSDVQLDCVAEQRLASIRRKLGVPRLHAAELGNGRLAQIASDLIHIQKRFQLRFNFYRVVKQDHAIISFFDQVFDQGINPAVTWTGYWSPLRYLLLLKLAHLFDSLLAQRAWSARINLDNNAADVELVNICRVLQSRIHDLPDLRSRQLIGDTLAWAIANPREITYNVNDKDQVSQITPNVIGFQCVLHGIADCVRRSSRSVSRIIVDRQQQFNKPQQTLASMYAKVTGVRMPIGMGMGDINFKGMPTIPIDFKSGSESAGLELVDIYLWIFKRAAEGKNVADELYPLVSYQFNRGRTDDISLSGIAKRFEQWDKSLPQLEEMSEAQRQRGHELHLLEEGRRLRAISGSSAN